MKNLAQFFALLVFGSMQIACGETKASEVASDTIQHKEIDYVPSPDGSAKQELLGSNLAPGADRDGNGVNQHFFKTTPARVIVETPESSPEGNSYLEVKVDMRNWFGGSREDTCVTSSANLVSFGLEASGHDGGGGGRPDVPTTIIKSPVPHTDRFQIRCLVEVIDSNGGINARVEDYCESMVSERPVNWTNLRVNTNLKFHVRVTGLGKYSETGESKCPQDRDFVVAVHRIYMDYRPDAR